MSGLDPSMEQVIQSFIQTRFRAAIGRSAIERDTPLFSKGIIDSFGVLELIAFLEDTFSVTIDPAVHELDEFDTIEKIVVLVGRLQQAGPDR